ncbi:flippase-like domain-containing protein [bacterium]|nr:flippase-like domain-containing protein [bacterium]
MLTFLFTKRITLKMKINKKLISSILLIIFSGFLLWFFSKNIQLLAHLRTFSWDIILLLMGGTIGVLWVNGLTLRIFAKPFGVKIEQYFWLSAATSFINMITPFRGGAGFRAWWMKKKYKLPYADFVASLMGNYVIVFFVSALVGCAMCIWLWTQYGIFSIPVVLLFTGFLLGAIFLWFFRYQFHVQNFFTRYWNRVVLGWICVLKHPRIVFQSSFLVLVNLLLEAIILFVILDAMGVEIALWHTLFIGIFLVFSTFLNITPGALGISEAFLVFAGTIVHISPEIMLLAALVRRTVSMIVLTVVGIPGKIILLRSLQK